MDRSTRNALTGLYLGLGALAGMALGIFALIKNQPIGWLVLGVGLFLGLMARMYREHEDKKRVIREALDERDEDRFL